MNQMVNVFFMIIGVFVVGFGIIFFSKESDEEKMNKAFIMSSNTLNTYARDSCTRAARDKVDATLYMPTESTGDNVTFARLVWKYEKDGIHTLACRYEVNVGITELALDGVNLNTVSGPVTNNEITRRGGGDAAVSHKSAGH